jgi:hypothetical protein
MRRIPLLLVLIAALGVVAAGPPIVSAQEMYLELAGPLKAPIPGDCSTWHEIYPNYCTPHHQDRYIHTDPSGQMAVCDYILLSGVWYHIEWVGPTYRVTFVEQGDLADFEPVEMVSGENPVCETWIEVWPDFGPQFHVDAWDDNGDGVVSVCDMVVIGGRLAHIDEIKVNIRVVPGDPVPIDDQTWGDVKKQY